jgi:hypothetical protein
VVGGVVVVGASVVGGAVVGGVVVVGGTVMGGTEGTADGAWVVGTGCGVIGFIVVGGGGGGGVGTQAASTVAATIAAMIAKVVRVWRVMTGDGPVPAAGAQGFPPTRHPVRAPRALVL